MSEAEQQKTTKTETTTSLLDQVLSKGFRAKSSLQKTEAKRDIETLVGEVLSGVKFGSKNVDKALQARIAEIDKALSTQLAAIMHHEDFQKLEGSWRGLSYLVHGSETGTSRSRARVEKSGSIWESLPTKVLPCCENQ